MGGRARHTAARRLEVLPCRFAYRGRRRDRRVQSPRFRRGRRVGTVIHPRKPRRPDPGRHHAGSRARGTAITGCTTSATGPAGQAVLQQQAADDSRAPANMQWAAVDLPDPETPSCARRRRSAVGAGFGAVVNGHCRGSRRRDLRRAPVTADKILMRSSGSPDARAADGECLRAIGHEPRKTHGESVRRR